MSPISVTQVNSLSPEEFVNTFGNVIELCRNAAEVAKDGRPFRNVEDIYEAFYRYLDGLSVEEKLIVLNLHPDLAGRLAAQGELTRESSIEQKSAGLDHITTDEKIIIDTCNKRYREKFCFPFIICARENKIQSIISGLRNRYDNTREEEIQTGIEEVKKICKLRIMDIVKNS